ncbi:hypothetical protein AVL60_04575 [Kocuria palustris]|nr:hypothetical protein AVL60_04575 [Kocuria palustris]
MATMMTAKKDVAEKEPLPEIEDVLAERDARAASGASTKADADKAAEKGPSRLSRLRTRLRTSSMNRSKEPNAHPGRFIRFVLRFLVVILDYMAVSVTALTFIPLLGAWLHQQSGTADMSLNDAGLIALWLVPFVFITVMIAVVEIAGMRWLWRAAGRVGRATALPADEPERVEIPAIKAVQMKTPSTTTNRGAGRKKRSK